MIAIEYISPISIRINGITVDFRAHDFRGRSRFMAFVAEDMPIGFFKSKGYTIHGIVADPPVPTLKAPPLASGAIYSLPETLAHAFLRGWTLEDLWGAGKGGKWNDEGGRGTCGLTVVECALASPPKGWVPGCGAKPWEMAGWIAPAQTWAPPVVVEPVVEAEPEVVAEEPAEEPQAEPEVEPEVEPVKEKIPESWTADEWERMASAIREVHKSDDPPKRGRLEWLWKNKATDDKRRKMPALSDDDLNLLLGRAFA
ncbi:MAG: hypothetical protein WC911_01925 [Thermoleophilia bacterium]